MYRAVVGLLLLLACSPLFAAQGGSATGSLTVTATVVSSSFWAEQPDGSLRLIVANAPAGQDLKGMQAALNTPPRSPEVLNVQLISPAAAAERKHAHRR